MKLQFHVAQCSELSIKSEEMKSDLWTKQIKSRTRARKNKFQISNFSWPDLIPQNVKIEESDDFCVFSGWCSACFSRSHRAKFHVRCSFEKVNNKLLLINKLIETTCREQSEIYLTIFRVCSQLIHILVAGRVWVEMKIDEILRHLRNSFRVCILQLCVR